MSAISNGQAPRLGWMILLSLLLHVVVIVGGGTWKLAPSYRLTFGPVYEVKLVDRVPSFPMNFGVETEGLAVLNRSGALSVRREEAAIPIRRIERETKVSPEVKQALEEIKRRVAQDAPGPSSSSPAGGEGILNDYLRVMWERIRGEWVLPPGVMPSDRWLAVVHLRILKNGKLMDIRMEKSSGNAYFDRSVLRAIQKADPLPPFPPGIREESIEVGIRFHAQEAGR